MMRRHRLLVLALLPLAPAACKEAREQGAGTAEGEILPGSASDAMLPLDTVRSQAPLAPQAPRASAAPSEAAPSDEGAAPPATAQQ